MKSDPSLGNFSPSQKFPKSARLLSSRHYKAVWEAGNRVVGQWLTIDYRIGYASCPKLGLTVSRRYGKSHLRNRFKRLIREAFRQCYALLPKDIEINVIPRSSCYHVQLEDVKKELLELMQKIQQGQKFPRQRHHSPRKGSSSSHP